MVLRLDWLYVLLLLFFLFFLPVQVLEVKELWKCYITELQTMPLKKYTSLASNSCMVLCEIIIRVLNCNIIQLCTWRENDSDDI